MGFGLIEKVHETSVQFDFMPSAESTEPEQKKTFVLLCAGRTNK
jgi:hypothetical protein